MQSTGVSKSEMKLRIQPIPGYADYTEAENKLLSDWKRKLSEVYEKFGFTGFNSRPVEKWDNLRKDGTDQQVFRICRDDGSPTDLALPFDRTVSLALYVAKYVKEIAFPFKRQDINYSHRGEAPQPGRFRAFYQCDVDIISRTRNVQEDIECMAALLEGLNALEVPPFVMYINQIELPKAMIRHLGVVEEQIPAVLRLVDKLDKKPKEEIALQICDLCPELNVDTVSAMVEKFTYRGLLDDFKVQEEWGNEAIEAVKELKEVFELLPAYGIDPEVVQFSPGMVRGLAYYTGLVFETFLKDSPELGSISSGGRYDNLCGDLNPSCKSLGGVGGAIGLTRLFDILSRKELIDPKQRSVANVVVAFHNLDQREHAIRLATELRNQGITVDLFTGKNTKKFFGYTDKKKVPCAILVKDGQIAVKDMLVGMNAVGKQQDFTSDDEAICHVKKLLGE